MNIVIEFLILCITLLSFAKSTDNKDNYYKVEDGDTIIDKILSSHRFTELANIIADKAVEKLNNVDSDSVASNDNVPAPQFKSTDVKTNEEIGKDKPESKHHKLEKIDIDAVLKTKVIPTKDLTFRYENFFNSKNNNTEATETYLNTYNDTKAGIESIDDDALESHELTGERSRNDKDEDIESEEKIDDRNKEANNRARSVENSLSNEVSIAWKEKDNEKDPDTDVKPHEIHEKKKMSDNTQRTEFFENREKYGEENEKLESIDKGDDNNLNLGRKQGDNQDLEMDYEDSTKTSVPLLRREGDKVFAFEESPDYKEYHEKLAEMRTKPL